MALTWSELYSKILLNAREKRTLVSASFELTSRCNLQCKMCYICESANNQKVKKKELSAAQWVRLAEEARDIGLLYVTLTGGEVFLREDFKEIYEQLTKLGLVIQIYTNGTMINQEIIRWLKTIPPFKVSITLYGASRETYQKVTGYAEGYDRTVRAIDSLLAAGISTEIKTTVVQGNMHEFDQLSEFALQRDLPLGVVNYVSPRRTGSCSDPLGNRLSPYELVQYEKHISERNQRLKNENKTILHDALTDEKFADKQYPNLQLLNPDDAFQCFAGKCGGWVTWEGRLLTCGIMSKPETYPLNTGFQVAWEELKHQCTLIPVCQECLECKYIISCESCPARLLNETGHYDKPAPYLCETAQRRATA